jgi:exodeoxyribonuclease VII small subunit
MTNTKTYAELVSALDNVMSELQSTDIDVDKTIELYEKGIQLTSELSSYLEAAENKLTNIKKASK